MATNYFHQKKAPSKPSLRGKPHRCWRKIFKELLMLPRIIGGNT